MTMALVRQVLGTLSIASGGTTSNEFEVPPNTKALLFVFPAQCTGNITLRASDTVLAGGTHYPLAPVGIGATSIILQATASGTRVAHVVGPFAFGWAKAFSDASEGGTRTINVIGLVGSE